EGLRRGERGGEAAGRQSFRKGDPGSRSAGRGLRLGGTGPPDPGGGRGLPRGRAQWHARHQESLRRVGRRQEALAPEEDRPEPAWLDPFAHLEGRRYGVRAAAARLRLPVSAQETPWGAALGPFGQGQGRKADGRGVAPSAGAEDEGAGPARRWPGGEGL